MVQHKKGGKEGEVVYTHTQPERRDCRGALFLPFARQTQRLRRIYETSTINLLPIKTSNRYNEMNDQELNAKLDLLSTDELNALVNFARTANAANHARRLAELRLKDALNHSLDTAPHATLKK